MTSEDLADELEALNSIYGDGTLTLTDEPGVFILNLPGELSSLRLRFPPAYPAEPPTALGTHSSGHHGKRGTAARDLGLFLAALGTVYEPGQVCLFDAIEEITRLVGSAGQGDGADSTETADSTTEAQEVAHLTQEDILDGPEPPWVRSDPVVEMKSTFVARCAAVASPDEASRFVRHLLASDKKVRAATHNITAWRIKGENNTSFQDCDDDGETAAGGRLLHLMQLMDLWNVMVVVTRWYGGQKLGPRRFALINQAARDAFVRAGLVDELPIKKKTHGK